MLVNMVFGFCSTFHVCKATLRVSPRGGKKKLFFIKKLLLCCLRQWQQGDLITSWKEARQENQSQLTRQSASISKVNGCCSLNLAREGRFGDAMKALGSHGWASCDDANVLQERQSRHPQHALLQWSDDIPSSLVVDSQAVLLALKGFF